MTRTHSEIRVETGVMDEGEQLAATRAELRFELGLLHDRVNALLTAEAFLTIAYTAAMSNGTAWGALFAALVGPTLALLGLLLAMLAWPGVTTTAKLVLQLTDDQAGLLTRQIATAPPAARPAAGALRVAQRRSLLFFRAVPAIFAVVWIALAAVAVAVTH